MDTKTTNKNMHELVNNKQHMRMKHNTRTHDEANTRNNDNKTNKNDEIINTVKTQPNEAQHKKTRQQHNRNKK